MPHNLINFDEPLLKSPQICENTDTNVPSSEGTDKHMTLKLLLDKISFLHDTCVVKNEESFKIPSPPKSCYGSTEMRTSQVPNENPDSINSTLQLNKKWKSMDPEERVQTENERKNSVLHTSSSIIFPKQDEKSLSASGLPENQGRTLFWKMSLEHIASESEICEPPTLPVKQRRSSEFLQVTAEPKNSLFYKSPERSEGEYEVIRKLPPIPILRSFPNLEKLNSTETASCKQPLRSDNLNPPALPPRPRSREHFKKIEHDPFVSGREASNLEAYIKKSVELSEKDPLRTVKEENSSIMKEQINIRNECVARPIVPPRLSKISSVEYCYDMRFENNRKDVDVPFVDEYLSNRTLLQNSCTKYPSKDVRRELVEKKLTPEMTEQITEALIQSLDQQNIFKIIMGKTNSTKSDFGDEIRGTSIILDGPSTPPDSHKLNGQVMRSSSHDEVRKKNSLNGKIYNQDTFEIALSDKSHSDCGSLRSNDSHRRPVSGASKSIEQSDIESVSIASHDSKESNNKDGAAEDDVEEGVVVLRKRTPKSKETTINNFNRKTRKRTRKFVIDGVLITTTTSKVIYGDEENYNFSNPLTDRKQELRELKYLQKQEQKQFQDLALKENQTIEAQDKKFEQERFALEKQYETDLDNLSRQQRLQIEKAEAQQDAELRNLSKKIRADQERELKQFRESLKQEMKLLKAEIEMLPKECRKMEFKIRKEKMDADHAEREKAFLENLNESHESSLRRLSDSHRERIALTERQFLQQKQQLIRSQEAALWEIEEKQIHEKHQLMKRQIKEIFILQRHQMLTRHEKEKEQIKRRAARKEEELLKKQSSEKRSLPKRIRTEMKARELMFRESMRISVANTDPELEKNKFKEFQEKEKKRYQAEQQRFELKHSRQLEELRAMSDATIKELEQLQNEKRKMLLEHETQKLKQREEAFGKELRDWKAQLKPRKMKLEETFNQQLEEQERVYGPIGPIILPHDLPELSQENARMATIGSSTRSSLSSMSEGY